MKKLLLIAALITSTVHATELEASCDLERARAEVLATVIEAPYIYGSVSNAANDKGATLGAGYSFAGRSRAKLIRAAADARCTALGATLVLDEQRRWLLVTINKAAAKAELELLLVAKVKAAEHVQLLQAQLNAQTATLAEYNAARQAQQALDSRMAQLRLALAEPSQPITERALDELLATARTATARAAELDARANAEAAWDLSLIAGGRKEFTGTSSPSFTASKGGGAPFVGLTFSWSFGSSAAQRAATAVKDSTERLFTVSEAGYATFANKLLERAAATLKTEQERERTLAAGLQETEAMLASLGALSTASALNVKRTFALQALTQQAELAGVRKRVSEYQAFMQRN